MTDTHGHGHHAGPSFQGYMVVAGALAIFTAASFVVNGLVRNETIEPHIGFTLILGVAVCKALLVGAFFMHLKWEWAKLYFMIVPVFILGTMMIMVLLPDIVIAWHRQAEIQPAIRAAESQLHRATQ